MHEDKKTNPSDDEILKSLGVILSAVFVVVIYAVITFITLVFSKVFFGIPVDKEHAISLFFFMFVMKFIFGSKSNSRKDN